MTHEIDIEHIIRWQMCSGRVTVVANRAEESNPSASSNTCKQDWYNRNPSIRLHRLLCRTGRHGRIIVLQLLQTSCMSELFPPFQHWNNSMSKSGSGHLFWKIASALLCLSKHVPLTQSLLCSNNYGVSVRRRRGPGTGEHTSCAHKCLLVWKAASTGCTFLILTDFSCLYLYLLLATRSSLLKIIYQNVC